MHVLNFLVCNLTVYGVLQGVPIESHPSKLVGSRGSKTRYFDFDKLAEVCVYNPKLTGFKCILQELDLIFLSTYI